MRAILAISVLLLALAALFAVQNPSVVTVHFLWFTGDTLLLAVIAASFIAGVVAGFVAGLPSRFRCARRIRELSAEVAARQRPPAQSPPSPDPPEVP